MNTSNSQIQISWVEIYKFTDKKHQKIGGNKWFITEDQGSLYIRQKKSHAFVIGKQVIKILYESQEAYYFKYLQNYMAIVLQRKSPEKELIQYRMNQNGYNIVDWSTADASVRQRLKSLCGDVDKSPLKRKTAFQSFSYSVGGFFGAVNNMISKDANEINNQAPKKIQEIKRQSLSQSTTSNWDLFKMKAKQLNNKAAQLMEPASSKIGQLTKTVGEKFETSDNSVVRGIRDFGNNMKNSLNEGYKNIKVNENQSGNVNQAKQTVQIKNQVNAQSERTMN